MSAYKATAMSNMEIPPGSSQQHRTLILTKLMTHTRTEGRVRGSPNKRTQDSKPSQRKPVNKEVGDMADGKRDALPHERRELASGTMNKHDENAEKRNLMTAPQQKKGITTSSNLSDSESEELKTPLCKVPKDDENPSPDSTQ